MQVRGLQSWPGNTLAPSPRRCTKRTRINPMKLNLTALPGERLELALEDVGNDIADKVNPPKMCILLRKESTGNLHSHFLCQRRKGLVLEFCPCTVGLLGRSTSPLCNSHRHPVGVRHLAAEEPAGVGLLELTQSAGKSRAAGCGGQGCAGAGLGVAAAQTVKCQLLLGGST